MWGVELVWWWVLIAVLLLWAVKCQMGDDGNVTKRRNGDKKHKVLLRGTGLSFVCWVVVGNRCHVREKAISRGTTTSSTNTTNTTNSANTTNTNKHDKHNKHTKQQLWHNPTTVPPHHPLLVRLRTPVQNKTKNGRTARMNVRYSSQSA